MKFGEILLRLRTERGWTQKQLADRAVVSQKAISFYEMGLRHPTWDAVQALCKALDVDCAVFMEKGNAKGAKAKAK